MSHTGFFILFFNISCNDMRCVKRLLSKCKMRNACCSRPRVNSMRSVKCKLAAGKNFRLRKMIWWSLEASWKCFENVWMRVGTSKTFFCNVLESLERIGGVLWRCNLRPRAIDGTPMINPAQEITWVCLPLCHMGLPSLVYKETPCILSRTQIDVPSFGARGGLLLLYKETPRIPLPTQIHCPSFGARGGLLSLYKEPPCIPRSITYHSSGSRLRHGFTVKKKEN